MMKYKSLGNRAFFTHHANSFFIVHHLYFPLFPTQPPSVMTIW